MVGRYTAAAWAAPDHDVGGGAVRVSTVREGGRVPVDRCSVAKRSLRVTARALSGWTYVALGFDVVRDPAGRVRVAGGFLRRLRELAPVPVSDETLVRVNGMFQVCAGIALMAGVRPRTAAALLAASMVPTTASAHLYWTYSDPKVRTIQRIQLLKNGAMIGGLLFAVLDA